MKHTIITLSLMLIYFGSFPQKKSADIKITFKQKDSVKYITAKIKEKIGDSIGKSVEGLEILFFAERTFSLLPIGGMFNTTDENGETTIEFPADLPADTLGNTTIVIKIEDAENIKDTTLKQKISWGIPIKIDILENKRTLWAARANAPLSLIILVNSILLVVWGFIFYIAYQLYLIYKA